MPPEIDRYEIRVWSDGLKDDDRTPLWRWSVHYDDQVLVEGTSEDDADAFQRARESRDMYARLGLEDERPSP